MHLLCRPFVLGKIIRAREVTSFHVVARVAPAQGSLPSTATRAEVTCGETLVELQFLNFSFWKSSHYMTVLVLAERDHLSCHTVKLRRLTGPAQLHGSSILKQVPWIKLFPQRPQCFYTECTKLMAINTDVFLLNI